MTETSDSRQAKLRKTGLIFGLFAFLCVFGFLMAFNGEPAYTISRLSVFMSIVMSFPLLVLVGASYFYPGAGGIVFIIISVFWAARTIPSLLDTSTFWENLMIVGAVSMPCMASGILLVLSDKKQLHG